MQTRLKPVAASEQAGPPKKAVPQALMELTELNSIDLFKHF